MAAERKKNEITRAMEALLNRKAGVPNIHDVVAKIVAKFGGLDGFIEEWKGELDKSRAESTGSRKVVLDQFARIVGMVESASRETVLPSTADMTEEDIDRELMDLGKKLKLHIPEDDAPLETEATRDIA